MLKQITCIILINSLLFPQYVFAACDPNTDPTCNDTSQFVDGEDEKVTTPENKKKFYDWSKDEVGKNKGQGQDGSQGGQDGSQGGGPYPDDPYAAQPEKPRGAGEKQMGANKDALTAAEKFKRTKAPGDFKGTGSNPTFPKNPFEAQASGKLLEESGTVKFLGTSLFLNCQRQTAKAWSDMVGTYKAKITTDMWPDSWWSLSKSIEQELEQYKLNGQEVEALEKGGKAAGPIGGQSGSSGQAYTDHAYGAPADDYGQSSSPAPDTNQCMTGSPFERAQCKILFIKSFVKKGIARGKGKSLTLNKCSALVPSTSFLDYNSSEDTLAITPKTSLDRKIACRSRGAETQDYPSCRKLVSWWDGFFIGKKLMETAQKVKYQMDAKDRQEDLAMDMASKNPDPLLPLKMQKAGVDDQAAVAFQNSFFLGAQYAVMQTKFSSWPSREEVVQTCQRAFTGEGKKTTLDKAEEFFDKFKPKKVEPTSKIPEKKEDTNLTEYISWFKELITGYEIFAKKIQITDLLNDFKKESEIPASCPVPPRSLMAGGYGQSGYGQSPYGQSGYSDYGNQSYQSGGSSGEGEGRIGGAPKYENCDSIFMQNLQMDAQSQPPMPQGAGGIGGAAGGYGQDQYGSGSQYGQDQYGSGAYGSGAYGSGQQGMETVMGGMLGQSSDPCIDVMNSGTQLILNFQSREALKMVLVQTGIEALTNLMKGMMLRKQSAKIQSLIDGLPVPDPTLDKLSQKEEDLIASVCQIAPQEPICADFANRSNGFYSPNIDLTPPGAATSLARVKAEEQGANAIEKEMAQIAATELGAAGAYPDASSGGGGAAGKTPSVTFKAADKGGAGGDIATDAKVGEAAPAAEKGAGGEETATPETGYTGGTEGREYKGPGFRADQYKGGPGGGTDKIAGEYGSLGFREPSSEGISPKEAGGLFKIISDRYEAISKDRRIEGKSEIAK